MEPRILDLRDVDIDEAADVTHWVERIRREAAAAPLVLRNCPQMLAHTLYKAGLLRSARIRVESSRQEEPYG